MQRQEEPRDGRSSFLMTGSEVLESAMPQASEVLDFSTPRSNKLYLPFFKLTPPFFFCLRRVKFGFHHKSNYDLL